MRHFGERGTDVAIYDYALYNEVILKNKSYIAHIESQTKSMISYEKFNARFKIFDLNKLDDIKEIIKEYNINYFYTLMSGEYEAFFRLNEKDLWGSCKVIKHCVFTNKYPEGDYCFSISNYLNLKEKVELNILPHIVSVQNDTENFRENFGIPDSAIVFGRYGGFDQFNITFVHETIIRVLNENIEKNIYFLFMNTQEFYKHERLIYLPLNIDLHYKRKFINTCDAMIHARLMGETFGLAIAEFSLCNKPIITCKCGDLEHILILKNRAMIYENKVDLINILTNFKKINDEEDDYNMYDNYNPDNVMNEFKRLLEH